MILSIFSCICWPLTQLLWKNIYTGSLPIFKNHAIWIFSLLLSHINLLCILDIYPLSNIWFVNIPSPSVDWFFTSLIMFFDAQSFLIFMESYLSIFSFVAHAFYIISKNPMPNLRQWRLFLFSSKSFMGLALGLLIHFELIFAYSVSLMYF